MRFKELMQRSGACSPSFDFVGSADPKTVWFATDNGEWLSAYLQLIINELCGCQALEDARARAVAKFKRSNPDGKLSTIAFADVLRAEIPWATIEQYLNQLGVE